MEERVCSRPHGYKEGLHYFGPWGEHHCANGVVDRMREKGLSAL